MLPKIVTVFLKVIEIPSTILVFLKLNIILIGLFLGFCAALYWYILYKQSHWKRLKVSSPDPTFFVGSFGKNWTGKRNTVEILDDFYCKFKDSGRVVGLYQLLTPQLLVVDPSLVKPILVTNFHHFTDTSFGKLINAEADPLLSRNPFFLTGKDWKEKRAEVTPAFSPARLKVMYMVMDSISERLIKYLSNRTDQAFEGRELFSRFTCDVVCLSVMSVDPQSFNQTKPKIRDMAAKIFNQGMGVQLQYLASIVAPSIAKLFNLEYVPKDTQNFFSSLMAQAVKQRQISGSTHHDYLQYLLQMQGKKHTSDLELAANAVTFFLDGQDTVAVGIACVLFELARNRSVQTRLREELKNISGHEEIMNHEYLNMVLNEGFRIHPAGGFIVRECTTPIDMDLQTNGNPIHFRKGDTIYIPTWSIHHDSNIYPDPEEFKPERFAGDAFNQYKNAGCYLAFGAGPRFCVGQKFAVAQTKVCIAAIVKNFEISIDSKTQLPLVFDPKDLMTLFTYYVGGIWLRFREINESNAPVDV